MIEYLFISKVRVKILHLFFSDVSQEIHIRAIVRKIKEEINAVRRELRNMQAATILLSEKRGNRLYYRINPQCPIFYELLGLVHKEFGLGGAIVKNANAIGSITYAILTSAFIDNLHPSPYDIDLLVVGDINLNQLSSIVKGAETEIEREVGYTVLTEDDFEFRKKKRDSFIVNILNKHKIMLVGDENRFLA